MTYTLGAPGLELKPGDHICAIYPTLADRDDILKPFLRDGLNNGDKCLCVLENSSDTESVLAALGADTDLEPFLARRQLDACGSADVFVRGEKFSTDMVIEFWDQVVGEAISGEFSFARGAGEMTWALRLLHDIDDLVVFESKFNRFLPRYPQMFICLYELGRFSGETLANVLKTHPKVLLGNMIIDNPYFIEPDEFLATRR
jgi:hypothetical protein